jgi:uncharacterized protein (TIGR02117 family)
MRTLAGRGLRYGLGAVLALAALVAFYFAATIAGAAIPARAIAAKAEGEPAQIYLLTGLLHADFAIPVDDALRKRFAFLREGGIPVDHPNLRYLVFGWGARDFYTKTRMLADIRLLPALKGIVGDTSVMHVLAANDVKKDESAVPLSLPPGGLDRLLGFIERSFQRNGLAVQPIEGVSYGMSDAFFEGAGRFHILRPCNIWVAQGLREAGVPTGLWTPTTWSLLQGLSWHSEQPEPGLTK